MTRRLILASGLTLLAFIGAASAGAPSLAQKASSSAHATALRIVVPGQAGAVVGAVSAPPDAVASEGAYAYPEDGSVLAAGVVTAHASAGVQGAVVANASAELQALSLFRGEITIDSVTAKVAAAATTTSGGGDFDGTSIANLVVLGAPVQGSPGLQVPLADWGYAVVLSEDAVPGTTVTPPGYHGSLTALDVHLTADHGGLPAGSEIVVGYADAAAQAAAPPPPTVPTTTAPATTPPATTSAPPPPPSTAPETTAAPPTTVAPPAPPPPSPPSTAPAPPPPPAPRPAATIPSKAKPAPPSKGAGPKATAAKRPAVKAKPKKRKAQPKPPEPPEAKPGGQPSVHLPPQLVTPKLVAGPYVFPVYGPSGFSDTYGTPRADVSWHHGDDIFAPLGAPVVAVANGTVFSVGWNHLGGYRLWLRDRQGNQFYYAHLSAYSPLAVNGRHVRAGDVLGFVGNTGDAVGTPYHLHFEAHPVTLLYLGYDGATDPTTYLNAWKHVHDIRFRPAAGWAPPPLPAGPNGKTPAAPPPSVILLQVNDISSASGLDPGSLERVLDGAAGEGDGALLALASPPPDGGHPVLDAR